MQKKMQERSGSSAGTGIMVRLVALMAVIVAAAMKMPCSAQADVFDDAATNPAFMRDVHLIGAGGSRTGSARTNNGQTTGISSYEAGVAANIWNNEHNQVLAGIQYGRREFDRPIALPDGFAIPERLDNLSAALLYKHITSGNGRSVSRPGTRNMRPSTRRSPSRIRSTWSAWRQSRPNRAWRGYSGITSTR